MPCLQELQCREEELSKAQLQQKIVEEHLRQREQELEAREIDLLERELHMMIAQQQSTPTPNKRKGKFKRNRLKQLKKEPGQNISFPSGERLWKWLSSSSPLRSATHQRLEQIDVDLD